VPMHYFSGSHNIVDVCLYTPLHTHPEQIIMWFAEVLLSRFLQHDHALKENAHELHGSNETVLHNNIIDIMLYMLLCTQHPGTGSSSCDGDRGNILYISFFFFCHLSTRPIRWVENGNISQREQD
jgi:hypothetical protein